MNIRSTDETLKLKEELEKRGIIVEAEKWDGHKHIDLVVTRARLNIEVDGRQHYQDPFQILADMKRAFFSIRKGYDTVHIPNVFVQNISDCTKIADALTHVVRIRAHKLGHRFHYHSYSHRYPVYSGTSN